MQKNRVLRARPLWYILSLGYTEKYSYAWVMTTPYSTDDNDEPISIELVIVRDGSNRTDFIP
jgi:hypothetical protein